MSSIIRQIEPEHRELFALEFGKIAESDFVYTPASTNINQSAPNLVIIYLTIRSQMSYIMDLLRTELAKLFALEFAKITESDCFRPSFYKCRPITCSTKHGHNMCDNEILDEFDLGSNQTVTSGVICP